MSMITAQCDELRAMAESVGLEVPQAATLMIGAADAIERLVEQAEDLDFELDKWQTKAEYFKQLAGLAEAEADKLREENARLRSCLSDDTDNARQIMAENARLRELAERAWKSAEMLCQAFDGPCRDDGVTIYKPCPMGERDEECIYGQLQRDLRELRVEVDG